MNSSFLRFATVLFLSFTLSFSDAQDFLPEKQIYNSLDETLAGKRINQNFPSDFLLEGSSRGMSRGMGGNESIGLYDTVTTYLIADLPDERRTREIDDDGNVLLEQLEYWQNGQWNYDHRILQSYDNGNMVKSETEVWDNGEWVNRWRSEYSYDDESKLIFSVVYKWVDVEWHKQQRDSYEYDENGSETKWVLEYWENDKWVMEYRNTYKYDNRGNEIEYIEENKDLDGRMRYYKKYEKTFNENNKLEESILYVYAASSWTKMFRFSNQYDENGNQIEFLFQKIDGRGWGNYQKYLFTHDSKGNALTDIAQVWIDDEWINDVRYDYTYDSNNKITTSLLNEWSGNEWQEIVLDSFNYNSSISLTYHSRYVFPEPGDQDMWLYREIYTADDDGNIISGYYQIYEDETWKNAEGVLEIISRDLEVGSFRGYDKNGIHRIEISYKEVDVRTDTDEIPIKNTFTLYPNPAYDYTIVEFGEEVIGSVELYDIQGRRVNYLLMNNRRDVVIPLSSLQAGIYFLKAKINSGDIYTTKLIKE